MSRLAIIQAFRQRHQKKEIAFFLLGGFTFDVLTLGRIDDVATLLQQLGYLTVLGALLALEEKWRITPPQSPRWLVFAWAFREDVLHFFFGCLLSLYAIFYFKSASGFAAEGFLVALFVLLIANELPRFRHLGPMLRMTLWSFCLTSFFAYLIPVMLGSIGAAQFYTATVLGFLPSVLFYRWLKRWTGSTKIALQRAIVPAAMVQLTLIGLYTLRAIPPVPLSVQEVGVYHEIQRDAATWHLSYRPTDYFWQRADRRFLARPGDKIHLFARIFAPRRFRDKVVVRWFRKEGSRWTLQDSIPFVVVGGRERGFRGFARKANFSPGKWFVAIETLDGRVIGTLRFRVEEDLTTEEREFAVRESDPASGPFVGAQVLAPEPKKPVAVDGPGDEDEPRADDTPETGDEVHSGDGASDEGGGDEAAGDADAPKGEDAPVDDEPDPEPEPQPVTSPVTE